MYVLSCLCFFFFFKQKTAYEMRISVWSSDVCSSDLKHDFQCLEHNLYVRSERPAADILGIELNPPFVIDVIAPTYLPKSGNAWPAAEIILDVLAIARHLGRNDRPRSDQTHIALQDVEDLWQLVEAALAQESADHGYARIVRELEVPIPFRPCGRIATKHLFQHFFRIGHHRAKLPARECPAVLSDARMPEERRPAVQFDDEKNQRHQRGEQQERHEGADDVEGALRLVGVQGLAACLGMFVDER